MDKNLENKCEIYKTYTRLHDRQEAIKPLLPLRSIEENRDAVFKFENYSSQIITVKDEYSDFLYSKSKFLIENATSKHDNRLAYQELDDLNEINPNYLDANRLIADAYRLGVDYVIVRLQNKTEMLIPKPLETDLLSFGTYGLNNVWLEYHNKRILDQKYDHELVVDFRSIKIFPEQLKERELIKEKEV